MLNKRVNILKLTDMKRYIKIIDICICFSILLIAHDLKSIKNNPDAKSYAYHIISYELGIPSTTD